MRNLDATQHQNDAAMAVVEGGMTVLKDPVCGMKVTPQSKHHLSHAGDEYFFCSAGCAAKSSADPKKYLDPRPAPVEVAAKPHAIYTCPMHSQIRQVGPGNCPICGMSLEPADASMAEDNTELRLMTRRLWIAAALSLPIALVAMTEVAPALFRNALRRVDFHRVHRTHVVGNSSNRR